MAAHFDIREYESFVDRSALERHDVEPRPGMHLLPHRAFEALEAFVLENRSEGTEAVELMSLGARKGFGKIITAKNYIGLIAFKDGTTVQIWPKLTTGEDDDSERRVFLRMLQAVANLPMKEFDLARLSTANMGVLEPFIRMFVRAVTELAKRGLRGSYTEREGNERFLKGRIDFTKDLKLNHSHRERFYVRYDEFGFDRPENRLIKSTLILLRDKTRSLSSRRDIDSALRHFADVSESADVDQDFARRQLDRTMGAYEPILKWCRVFLHGESFTSFKGSEVASSLLFPMETLFEAYVAKLVRIQAATMGWKATVQDNGIWLYDTPKRFRMQPDIVLRKSGCQPVILDTKWKRIDNVLNDGISQADMYQMYAYQHRYGASKTILVYPRHEGVEAGHRSNYTSSKDTKTDALNQVFVFDLANANASARNLVELAVSSPT